MVDDFFLIDDDDGNTVGMARLEDVTGDGIPDVIHFIDQDGERTYLPLNEVEVNRVFAEIEDLDGNLEDTSDISFEYDNSQLEELQHHIDFDEPNGSLFPHPLRETDGLADAPVLESLFTDSMFSEDENVFGEAANISFTGLTDKGLTNSDTYRSWLDGIEPDELTPDDIANIASHMADEFNQVCPAVVADPNRGGFAIIPDANGIMFYDVEEAIDASDKYGINNVVGSIAHEFGHNITARAFEDSDIELSRIQQEMCADYIEGIILGLTGVSPEGKYEFLRDHNVECEDYPSAEERIEIIQKGYDYASSPVHRGLAPLCMPNLEFVQNQLMQNVISQY